MMRKKIALLAGSFLLASLSGAPLPSGYKLPADRGGVLASDDFSGPLKKWKENAGLTVYKIVPGTGDNGSPGLVYERKDPNAKDGLLNWYFKAEPGKRYRARIMFKAENVHDLRIPFEKNRLFVICAEFYDKNGKWLSGVYPVIPMPRKRNLPWSEAAVEFAVPPTADKCSIGLYFRNSKVSGKITYDNFVLEKLGAQAALIYPVMPKQLTLTKDGRMEFRIFDYAGTNEKDLRFKLRINGKKYIVPVKKGMAGLKIVPPPPGKYTAELFLLNTRSKIVAGHEKYTFTVLKNERPPQGAVTLDRKGRVKIDGKNFLPLGMFAGYPNINAADLKKMKEAGFNCIMPYMSAKMAPNGLTQKTTPALKAGMDLLHKNGIKIMFCLKAQVNGGILRFESAKGSLNVAEYVASKVCRHPALLGWYITDENQPGDLPAARELRQRLSLLDPYHPVLTLTNAPSIHLLFGQTGDILMVDRYPIRGKESRSMATIRDHFTSGIGNAKMGVWFVPQTFHWGAYQKPVEKFRFPTEEEMRSMMLLAMNMGAAGYCFYSYPTIFTRQEKIFPGSAKWFWPQVVRVAKMLRSLEEFFFTDDVKKVPCVNKGKNFVEAKIYRSGKKVCVAVTCDGPGKAEAVLTLPKNLKLKSHYGRTVQQKDGSWKFTGFDIGSDLLTGEIK